MSLAVLASQALAGMCALPVRVEVHVGSGLPSFQVVGLPDTGVRESRERVRSAILSSGFDFPAGRITVNLAPADLPKESGRFDLPIALGILLASGQAIVQAHDPAAELARYVFAGELSLTGAIMPVASPLSLALGVAARQPERLFVLPAHGASLAAHVPGVSVLAAASLRQVVEHFSLIQALVTPEPCVLRTTAESLCCLSEVRGQGVARRVLEVAAAGRHSLLMVGPPGTGKSMLAHRLPGLLPPLTAEQALESAAVQGLCAGESPAFSEIAPFRSPHHSVSMAALVGGGLHPRPGEISRAHHGVLFLDELPEFSRPALEALREPLETGVVAIARAARASLFPASFQLVAAMNPCPCGWSGHPARSCTCTPDRIVRYRSKLSGPFLDRMDLHIVLHSSGPEWLHQPAGESSMVVRQRVQESRERQRLRQGCVNAALTATQIQQHCQLDKAGAHLVERGLAKWCWSSRAVHRLLRVARTLADMDAQTKIADIHVAEAIQYRQTWADGG